MKYTNVTQEFKSYYTAGVIPEIIEVSEARYLSILGMGSPGTDIFYQKKTAVKTFVRELQSRLEMTDKAFNSSIIEIFYWYDDQQADFIDIGEFYTTVDLSLLRYRIAIRLPDVIGAHDVSETAKKSDNPFAQNFEFFTYAAGKCVQLLHIGPFAAELKTLKILQQFADSKHLKKVGMHHEIHLINFEYGESQEHLQTILRDPVTELKH